LTFLRIYPITSRHNHADDLRAINRKKKKNTSLYIYIEYIGVAAAQSMRMASRYGSTEMIGVIIITYFGGIKEWLQRIRDLNRGSVHLIKYG
jgi:hypothetical protein